MRFKIRIFLWFQEKQSTLITCMKVVICC